MVAAMFALSSCHWYSYDDGVRYVEHPSRTVVVHHVDHKPAPPKPKRHHKAPKKHVKHHAPAPRGEQRHAPRPKHEQRHGSAPKHHHKAPAPKPALKPVSPVGPHRH